MIINRPLIFEENDEICVSTKIEIQNSKIQVPDTLWFKLSKSYRQCISDRTDAFVVAMLPIAMGLGEDMEVKGKVSPRLAYGIQEYQQIQSTWWPNQFKVINIKYSELESTNSIETKGAVGCSFSGGVDSFYTLWSHLAKNEKIQEYRATHCLIINGFDKDVDLDNSGSFQEKIQQTYEPMLKSLGLELLIVRTNIQQLRLAAIGRFNLHQSFGAVLTTPALLLGRLFSRFYIPSSYKYNELIPEGAHPLLDHLLSTETMETIHDGANASRIEKTIILTHWPETYSRLRVCWKRETTGRKKTDFINNCCKCTKCIRTMISLDLIGTLPKYTLFPQPLKRRDIRKTFYSTKGSWIFAKENLGFAIKIGRKDMAFDIRYAMLRSILIKKTALPLYKLFVKAFKIGIPKSVIDFNPKF